MKRTDATAGLRIFIVEDEALMAEGIQDRLTRLGFETVGIADTSDKAIAIAAQQRPDLVLMDIRLNGPKDGIEAATFIRQHLHIPVIYLTAPSDQATLTRAKESGPFGYVLQPVQEEELLLAIEMAMNMHVLEQRLEQRVRDRTAELEISVQTLQKALAEIKVLRGFLQVCAWCRKIQNDTGRWQKLESYLAEHSEAQISHAICPECLKLEKRRFSDANSR